MAEIDLNPIFQGVRNKVGKMVFYRRNGETCMRTLGTIKKSSTPAQQRVRAAFSSLIETWNGITGIVQSGWNSLAKTRRKTGYNMFLAENFRACFDGRPIRLASPVGDLSPVTLNASAGAAGQVRCEFNPAPLTDGRRLVVFYQGIAGDGAPRPLEHIDFGENTASPAIITGLEPGAMYAVYAVVTDQAYAEATAVSESSGVMVAAGL